MKKTFFLDPRYANLVQSRDTAMLTYDTVWLSKGFLAGCSGRIFMGVLALLVLLLCGFFVIRDIHTRIQFHLAGIPVVVTVTDCEMYRSKSDSQPDLTYTYSVDGVQYTTTDRFDTSLTCKHLPVGGTLDGVVLSYDPQSSWVHVPGYPPLCNMFTFIVAVVMALGMLLLLKEAGKCIHAYITARLAYPRLKRAGQLIDGTVIECQWLYYIDDDKTGRYFVTVIYSFMTPDGRTLTRQQSRTFYSIQNWQMPEQGTPVKVLYVGDNACVML